MSGHDEHDDLRRALHDAVDDHEPRPGIDAIRRRTAGQSPHRSRPWLFGAVGAAVATAAVIAAVAVVGGTGDEGAEPQPGGTVSTAPTGVPSTSAPAGPSPSEPTGTAPGGTVAAGIYFAGDTPQGVRLYREFQRVDAGDRLLAAANLAVQGTPVDPDYRTLWPEGAEIAAVSFDGVGADGLVQVGIADPSLHDRPPGMTEREAGLAVQQVVYTLQGAVGARAPVQFLLDGNPVDTVLGVPTAEPLANDPQLDVLSLVNITAPEEGATVRGDTLEISGVASSFEATVPVELRRGDAVVRTGFATAEGWQGRLYPWRTTLDVSGLPPGAYTVVARTDDPSGGEGPGPYVDTKAVTLG
jgi:hypothetical protein